MRLMITGSNGQLGRCLQDRIDLQKHQFLALDAADLDITDRQAVTKTITEFKPDIIINAAAYTAVDKAESDKDIAYAVNAIGPRNLAEAAKTLDVPIIHVSTDYVFNGKGVMPYEVSSDTSPNSVYGETKLAGEVFVKQSTDKYIIFRTAWVFSEYGNNFVKTMLRLASERNELGVVADQYGCPTYAGDLADVILLAAQDSFSHSTFDKFGVYHFCGDEVTSWHGFARTIFSIAKDKSIIPVEPKLNAIKTEDYPTPATRPEYSVLNCSRTDCNWLVNRDWQSSLANVLTIIRSFD